MKIYIAVLFDRHVDDTYSVHKTLEGADQAVDKYIETCKGYGYDEWHERAYGYPKWVRYVETFDDGPHALIEVSELLP